MWGHMGYYGWGWGGMGITMLMFWGLMIAALVVLLRFSRNGGGVCGKRVQEKGALDILKERYARGEVEREEFEQKKQDLEKS